jgi:predicted small lipoprotein YifL
MKMVQSVPALLLALTLVTGCQEKGPAEKAGESIDRAAEKARDAVDPAGPVEKAGRTVDRAVDGK